MILIADCGSQTTNLIRRKLANLGFKSLIVEPKTLFQKINEFKAKGIIISGGPSSVYEKGSPKIDKNIFSLGIPILGICYGWQSIAQILGGKVLAGKKEYGPTEIELSKDNESLITKGLKQKLKVWMSHGDSVIALPKNFVSVASTNSIKSAISSNEDLKFFGLQFHPEVDHTEMGEKILENFAFLCGEIKNIDSRNEAQVIIRKIKKQVGNNKVMCAVSGGVDSTVTAFLLAKAINKNLFPVFVDSGLNRYDALKNVKNIFKNLGINLIIVNAQNIFLDSLKGISDPEEKRKKIGELYIRVFENEAEKMDNINFLAQGTIYSDLIESKGIKNSSNIKSHHNVGGLPKDIKFQILEPIKHLFKDEVKKIGLSLGIDKKFIAQQNFPGPGFAIRIMGEVTKERLNKIKIADKIVIEEIKNFGYLDKVHMSFAIMTGAFSTAVKGDGRQFSEVVALRVIESKNIMTGDWVKLPYEVLQKISSRIVNEVPEISRVVYDITTKPPATMEWE